MGKRKEVEGVADSAKFQRLSYKDNSPQKEKTEKRKTRRKFVNTSDEEPDLLSDQSAIVNEDSQRSLPNTFSLLSLYGIQRRFQLRQRRVQSQRSRPTALQGCLYQHPPSVPWPPGAIPEHTPVWARVGTDMPAQPCALKERIAPYHLAHVVYSRPASGYSLGYIHGQGEEEDLDQYLLEWLVGSPQPKEQKIEQPGESSTGKERRIDVVVPSDSPLQIHSTEIMKTEVQHKGLNIAPCCGLLHSFPSNLDPHVHSLGFQVAQKSTRGNPTSDTPPPRSRSQSSDSRPTDSEPVLDPPFLACSPWHYDYYIHYQGFNRRYDRWCSLRDLLPTCLDPTTLQINEKAIARQLVSCLHAIHHSSVSARLKIDKTPKQSDDGLSSDDVANILALVMFRICYSCIAQLKGQEKYKQNYPQKEESDMPKTCNSLPTDSSNVLLNWFSFSKPKHSSMPKRSYFVTSVAHLASLWWSQIVLSYFQIDLVEIQTNLYTSAKKKRKAGNLSHPSAGPHPALLSACPPELVLKGLEGQFGITLEIFNSNGCPLQIKWKHLISHPIEAFPTPCFCLDLLIHIPSAVTLLDEKQPRKTEHSRPSLVAAHVAVEVNRIIKAAVDLVTRARHVQVDVEDAAPTAHARWLNPTGEDLLDGVESDAGEHEGLDKGSIEAHEAATKIRTIETIEINHSIIPTWYFSPFPASVHPTNCLHFCAGCLQFFKHRAELLHHEQLCWRWAPPGDEIYRDGNLSFFEVDGETEWAYCENLSLMAKLFLDHKTLQFSVTPFLFYVLVEWDDSESTPLSPLLKMAGLAPARNNRIVGYFSKEKVSSVGYNLACILTLPQHQRKGYGKFFIHFSYALSKIEQKIGTPERPLSDLGRISYYQYWKFILSEFLLSPVEHPPACACVFSRVSEGLSTRLCDEGCSLIEREKASRGVSCDGLLMGELDLSINDIVHFTSMKREDISLILEMTGVLRVDCETGDHVIVFNKVDLTNIRQQCGRPPAAVLPENFVWSPRYVSQQDPPTETPAPIPDFDHSNQTGFHFPNAPHCSHWA